MATNLCCQFTFTKQVQTLLVLKLGLAFKNITPMFNLSERLLMIGL